MTVNSTTTRELPISTIVLRAYQLASLAPPQQATSGAEWDAKAAMARDFLETEIDALQAEGVFARSVDFYDLSVSDGTASYTLPSTTLDLVYDGMYLPDSATTGETPVRPASREEYHALSDKTAEGRPHMYYLHRQATLTVYLYPVPNEAATITFQRHRLLADNDDGSATLDLQRYWTDYVTWALAHKLAVAAGLPVNRCGYIRSQADYKLERAKSYAHQNPNNQMVVTHRTPWS